jgi:Thioredoxin
MNQNETNMKSIVAKALFNSHSYPEYRKLVKDLLSEGKSTGTEQSESLTHYTSLNEARMNRLDKTIKISEDVISKLQNLDKHYIWMVISEGWCGDAAQILPVLNKMALASEKRIDLRIVLRDQNEELMSQYLTNGGKAIPKVIVICKEAGIVRTHWGPRPKGATELMANYKRDFGVMDEKIKTDLQLWYLADKGISVQEELLNMMENIRYNRL